MLLCSFCVYKFSKKIMCTQGGQVFLCQRCTSQAISTVLRVCCCVFPCCCYACYPAAGQNSTQILMFGAPRKPKTMVFTMNFVSSKVFFGTAQSKNPGIDQYSAFCNDVSMQKSQNLCKLLSIRVCGVWF